MKYKVLNRKGKIKVILIHGLFATSGYWLNYLTYFRNCQIIILELDYYQPLDFDIYIQNIESLVEEKFNGEVDFIFSHSLGSVLANGISDAKFKISFEICPVYSSQRIANEDFIGNIMERTGKKLDFNSINKKLLEVDSVLFETTKRILPSEKRFIFFPTNDAYFKYHPLTQYEIRIFEGDHFSIENALSEAFLIIDSYNSN
jgi:hypothetical protein